MSIITLRKLRLGFGNKVVIKGASLEIEEGDFVCVVGANGSGKSTLVKGILGLIKAFSGKIIYGEGLKNNDVGYLPQELRLDDNFPATVKEIVLSGNLGKMGIRPFYQEKEYEKMREVLKLLGIVDRHDVWPSCSKI